MKILVLDIENQFLDFVLRCVAWGHSVKWCRYSPKKALRDGNGFKGFSIIEDWESEMPWVGKDGLVICAGNYVHMQTLDRYREFGYKIFAPTEKSAEMEINRGKSMEVMKSLGFDLPPYITVKSLEEAKKVNRKGDKCYVFKTQGAEDNKDMTHVACDPAEMESWIDQQIARGVKLKEPAMLQEKIDLLCDYGVSGWVGPEGFLPNKFQICFEHKRLMPGEVGPQTGEMGSVCKYYEKEKLAEEMLLPWAPVLQALGHRGDFAIGVGIDKKGNAQFMETSARFGYPAWHIQCASHKGDPAQWMLDLLNGEDTLKVSYDVAIGVVMAQPPFPYPGAEASVVEGNPIIGCEDVIDDVHLCSVMLESGPKWNGEKIVKEPVYKTSGTYVLVATGLGKTVEQARNRVYKTVDIIKFGGRIFRDDIGEKIEPILDDLQKFGYAEDLRYS